MNETVVSVSPPCFPFVRFVLDFIIRLHVLTIPFSIQLNFDVAVLPTPLRVYKEIFF